MASIAELQAYLKNAAARSHEVHACPPFHLYLHESDAFRFYNYAIPDEPLEGLSAAQLAALRAAFAEHDRTLRFEFLQEYAPLLGSALDALGVPVESENPLLVCTPETWIDITPPAGVEIRRLEPDSATAHLAGYINTASRGFGEEGRDATPGRIADLRRRLGFGGGAFLVTLDGLPAAAGAYTAPLEGFTELVGIATLPEFRRRGIAAALTAALTRDAFSRGVSTAFLTAADDDASRVYQRSGFRRVGTGLAYGDVRDG